MSQPTRAGAFLTRKILKGDFTMEMKILQPITVGNMTLKTGSCFRP